MRNIRTFIVMALAMAFLAVVATAGTVEVLQFNGTGGIIAGGYYTAPYFGTLGGTPQLFTCIDDMHEIQVGDTWNAYIGSQTDLSHAYHGSLPNAAQLYGETFAVTSQILEEWNFYQNGTPAEQAASGTQIQFLQMVDWEIMNPGSQNLSTEQQAYLSLLEGQDLTTSFGDWRIASDVEGLKQEFVYDPVPEPATFATAGLALALIGVLRRRKTALKE